MVQCCVLQAVQFLSSLQHLSDLIVLLVPMTAKMMSAMTAMRTSNVIVFMVSFRTHSVRTEDIEVLLKPFAIF